MLIIIYQKNINLACHKFLLGFVANRMAIRSVPDGEMFTLSVRRSFMRRRASFPVPIRYACQFLSFFQYIIKVRASQTETLGLVFRVRCNFSYISSFFITTKREPCQYQLLTPSDYVWCRSRVAKLQGSGASDSGWIPWSDFFNVI